MRKIISIVTAKDILVIRRYLIQFKKRKKMGRFQRKFFGIYIVGKLPVQ